jgi:hypothetical protein
MTRVALYARYSSGNQSAASIEDQFRICREYVERQGWSVAPATMTPLFPGPAGSCGPVFKPC